MRYYVSVAKQLSTVANQVVDAALSQKTAFAEVGAACVARAAQSLCSATHLAQMGFIGDAMSVGRTIVELAIDFAYIATDPSGLVQKFIGYSAIQDNKLITAINHLHADSVDRNVIRTSEEAKSKYLEQNPSSKKNWAGKTLKERAELAFGRENVHIYDIVYVDMCGATHSGSDTLNYVMSDESVIRFGPMKLDPKPVDLASTEMFRLLKTVCKECTLSGFEDDLRLLWTRLNNPEMAPSETY